MQLINDTLAELAPERRQRQQRLVHCLLADQTGADRLLRQVIECDFETACGFNVFGPVK